MLHHSQQQQPSLPVSLIGGNPYQLQGCRLQLRHVRWASGIPNKCARCRQQRHPCQHCSWWPTASERACWCKSSGVRPQGRCWRRSRPLTCTAVHPVNPITRRHASTTLGSLPCLSRPPKNPCTQSKRLARCLQHQRSPSIDRSRTIQPSFVPGG